jgi:hypothetical protein
MVVVSDPEVVVSVPVNVAPVAVSAPVLALIVVTTVLDELNALSPAESICTR